MKAISCNFCGRDEYRVRYPAVVNGHQPLDVDAYRCSSAGCGSQVQKEKSRVPVNFGDLFTTSTRRPKAG